MRPSLHHSNIGVIQEKSNIIFLLSSNLLDTGADQLERSQRIMFEEPFGQDRPKELQIRDPRQRIAMEMLGTIEITSVEVLKGFWDRR